jgi:predicted DNA-binding protein
MPRQKKETMVILRLTAEQKTRLAQMAEQTGGTMSETIRTMIDKKTKNLKTA